MDLLTRHSSRMLPVVLSRPVNIISLGIKTYICYHLHGLHYLETIRHIDHTSWHKFAALESLQAGQILAVSSVETCQVIIAIAHSPPLVMK